MNLDKIKQKIDSFFDDSKSLEKLESYFSKITEKNNIINLQLDRFHKKIKSEKHFKDILEKILNKYNSDSYKDRWYSRGLMPSEDLLFFLYMYSEKYGLLIKEESKEYEKYSTEFSSEIYFIQGCLIVINK